MPKEIKIPQIIDFCPGVVCRCMEVQSPTKDTMQIKGCNCTIPDPEKYDQAACPSLAPFFKKLDIPGVLPKDVFFIDDLHIMLEKPRACKF